MPEAEISYITLHILGSKMLEKDLASLDFPFNNAKELELVVEIARNIIAVASDTLHIDLRADQALMNGLVLHLRPTINRLKYGLTLRNPILKEIKINYSDILGVAWLSSRIFEKFLAVKIPEAEISYITLHLAAAVERNGKRYKRFKLSVIVELESPSYCLNGSKKRSKKLRSLGLFLRRL